MVKALLAQFRFAIVHLRPLIPGGRCSQGGVKLPTGGKGGQSLSPRAPSPLEFPGPLEFPESRVSRFGAIPKPTVKVRMKENGRDSRDERAARRSVCPDSGPERGKP
jgi:hypothetical protein